MLSQKSISFLRPAKRLFATTLVQINKKVGHKEAKPPGWEEAKPLDSAPGPKPIPFFGNFWRFLPGGEYYKVQLHDLHASLQKKYGNFVAFKKLLNGVEDVYMLYDPKDFETMYRTEGTWPDRKDLDSVSYYRNKVRQEVFQGVDGLLATSGEEWAKFRTVVNPIMMQPRNVLRYSEVMDEIATEMIQLINLLVAKNTQMPDDFITVYNKWALESIAAVALDTRLGCLNPSLPKDSIQMKYINHVLDIFNLLYKLEIEPSPWRIISTPAWRKYVEVMDFITDMNLKYIEEATKRIEQNPTLDHEASILEKLIKKDKKIALAMVMDMLQAGVDTTSRTLAAATYYLAKNPKVQATLREEAKTLLPNKDSPVTKEVLSGVPYLRAVIKETTRLAPVAIANIRKTSKDVVIHGYQVPKGTWLIAGHFNLAISKEHVETPQEFIPERWLRNSTDTTVSSKKMHPFIFLPFGFGPRSCIGKRLANLELEIALLKIVRNYKMSWPHEDLQFSAKLVYGIDGPFKVQLEPIEE